ncbi:MAG TPA: right-handed parallel beta-helix repeat-containing protein [Sedimentisphaerales bacterium]|nr:right-handed parallel beta-helix repeat-containing protein [Sedimentisphaerales bacterium]
MRKTIWKIWLVVVVLGSGPQEVDAREYQTTILGTLGGDRSRAYCINDLGQIVGESTTAEGHIHAFIWEKGVMTDLGVFAAGPDGVEVSCAKSINNLGKVVGHSSYSSSNVEHPARAFLWENGQMRDIGTLGGNSYATAINNQGQIVGHCEGVGRAFLWHDDVMMDIGTLEGGRTYAYHINDNGQVVGESYISNGYNAFLWDDGQITNLGSIDSYGSVARGVNNRGDIVGSITPRGSYFRQEAALWQEEKITPLGYLDVNDPRSYAEGINESGQIVGNSPLRLGPSNPVHACLWEDDMIIELHAFIGPNFPSSRAYGINNSGQIVGYAEMLGSGDQRAFLMTPVASVYYVDGSNGKDENDGLSLETAFATIQRAIDVASNGDSVIVAPGTYTGKGNRDIDFLGKAITVRNTDPNDPNMVAATVIDCNGTEGEPHRGFHFHSGEDENSVLRGFTIRNGWALYGGGIYCYDSHPYIGNCIISHNKASHDGGGIYCQLSNCTIVSCTVTENRAEGDWTTFGGGMYFEKSCPTVSNCTITGNWSHTGGGFYCRQSTPTVTGSTISGNHGGGIACNESTDLQISKCTMSENSAIYEGGGICCWKGSGLITHCKISGNRAGHSGGGIHCEEQTGVTIITDCAVSGNFAKKWYGGGVNCELSAVIITNCTIAENLSRVGGGVHSDVKSSLSVANSILWGNGPWEVDGGLPMVRYCDIGGGWEGEGNIDVDPCFVQAGYWDANGTLDDANDDFWVDGDYHLLVSSPCINAGDPNFVGGPNETDIDGEVRVFAGRVDMGADEFVPSLECQMKFTPQVFNTCSQGPWAKAHFVLPPEFGLDDVDANSPLIIIEPVIIEAEDVNAFVNEEGMVEIHAAFDRSVFCNILPGNRAITAVGSLTNGRNLYGRHTIRIIAGNLKCLADFASHWLQGDCAAPDWCGGFDLDRNSKINFVDFVLYECCSDKKVE